MKNIAIILFVFLLKPVFGLCQYNLTIEIDPLANNSGKVLLVFMNEKEDVINKLSANIEGNKCTIVIKDIEKGKYAFKYFHDENNNKELDTNFLGIPKEDYGFSNDAKGTFGPPSFDKMIFEINNDQTIKCNPN